MWTHGTKESVTILFSPSFSRIHSASPRHLVTAPPRQLVTPSPHHLVTAPPRQLVTPSPHHLVTASPHHLDISLTHHSIDLVHASTSSLSSSSSSSSSSPRPRPRFIFVLTPSTPRPRPRPRFIFVLTSSSSSPRLVSYLCTPLSIPFLGPCILPTLIPVSLISFVIPVYHLYSSFHLRPCSKPLVSPFILFST